MAAKKTTESKLVSVVFKKPSGRYSPGDRAGFEPERAKSLIERRIAVAAGTAPSGDTGDGKTQGDSGKAGGAKTETGGTAT